MHYYYNSINEVTRLPYERSSNYSCMFTDLPDFEPTAHIDYIAISFYNRKTFQILVEFIESKSLPPFTWFNYDTNRRNGTTYQFSNDTRDYKIDTIPQVKPFVLSQIRIHEPDISILKLIEPKIRNGYRLSKIEFTIDMFTDNTAGLLQFLHNHLLLNYAGNPLLLPFPTTSYQLNCRKSSSKESRIYIKKTSVGNVVRLELTPKRPKLRGKGNNTIEDIVDLKTDAMMCNYKLVSFGSKLLERYFPIEYEFIEYQIYHYGINAGFYVAKMHKLDRVVKPHHQEAEFMERLSGLNFL